MLDPAFYSHHPPDVRLIQTHISYVLLAGAEVYKLKKPVRFAFLDFSTLERRRHFCHEEVRLNRRLAPGVYLGVVSVCRAGDGYRLGPADATGAVEYAVHMRRLPAERCLDRLLDRGEVTEAMIDEIAARLAEFHRQADAGPAIAANGDPSIIAATIADDFAEMRRFHGDTISRADDATIQDWCRSFLHRHNRLLRQRQATGRIRDCHGDLHTEHICFADDLIVFDCIEFNPKFRHRDVASEIGFLAMDLDYHGHRELAVHLIARYAEYAGDPDLRTAVPFYQCYLAYIRGKVDSLKSAEEDIDRAEREAARRSARRHFALAYQYTWAPSPFLVVLGGLSGTGKSTVATALEERTGFVHANSDVIRKQLAGVPLLHRPTAAERATLYATEHSARTYTAMFARASTALGMGRGVILDATFQRHADRDAARGIAAEQGVPLLLVECQCADDEVRRRLGERSVRGDSPSDADWSVYLQQQARYEPFGPADGEHQLIVDAAQPVERSVAAIEERLRQLRDT